MCAATDEVRKERDKETKHDTTIELAAILHEVSVRGQGERGAQRENNGCNGAALADKAKLLSAVVMHYVCLIVPATGLPARLEPLMVYMTVSTPPLIRDCLQLRYI